MRNRRGSRPAQHRSGPAGGPDEELAEENGASSIKATIDSINSQLARKFKENETYYVAKNYHSLRSAYLRGKKLSEP